MEAVAPSVAQTRRRGGLPATFAPAAGAWLLGFAPVVYLALEGGGYDLVSRSEVGVAVWWIVLIGVAVGALPRTRLSPAAWTAGGLLGGFLAWTWLAVGWSQSAELSLAEAARVATYLGFFVLGLAVVSRATLRHLVNGLACAIGLVATLAVLSRLVPAWFPANPAPSLYATARLGYPLNYSDAVGEFVALGVPLVLCVATGGRTLIGRAVAAAALPVMAACLFLTASRGGLLALVVGLIAFIALAPDRLPRLATLLAAAAGTAAILYSLAREAAVRSALTSVAAVGPRHRVLAVALLGCAAVALAQVAITLLVRHGRRRPWLRVSRGQARAVAIVCAGAVVVAAGAVVAGGAGAHLWREFKEPTAAAGGSYLRLFSIAGSHRYQYWQAAISAFETRPWQGIGPGTFQFWWAQHNTLAEYVQNAHSLYFETLAELGIPGLALILGFVVTVLGAGARGALRAWPTARLPLAAAVAGFAAFAAAAAFDWVWQIAVIPAIAMLLAAAALVSLRDGDRMHADRRLIGTRTLLAAAMVACLVAILIPLTETSLIQSSQAAANARDYPAALSDAVSARRIEPSAATPWLQIGLALEQLREYRAAAAAVQQAIAREPTNWSLPLVASRLDTELDRPRAALAQYRRARALNPTSPIFAQ